jgi:hypothetical protein
MRKSYHEIEYWIDTHLMHVQEMSSKEEAEKREKEYIESSTRIHPMMAKEGKGFHCKIKYIVSDSLN